MLLPAVVHAFTAAGSYSLTTINTTGGSWTAVLRAAHKLQSGQHNLLQSFLHKLYHIHIMSRTGHTSGMSSAVHHHPFTASRAAINTHCACSSVRVLLPAVFHALTAAGSYSLNTIHITGSSWTAALRAARLL
jgi:hypothetical protein